MKFIINGNRDTKPDSTVVRCVDLDNLFLITAKDIYKDKDALVLRGYCISLLMIPEEFGCYEKGKLIIYNTLQHTKLWNSIVPSLKPKCKIIFY